MRALPRARVAALVAIVALAMAAIQIVTGLYSRGEDRQWRTLRNPIDPAQQTDVAFGERSHWHQPWRAYLDTPPAARLRDAIGINFNVDPSEAEATAALLERSGFKRARIEIGWDQMRFNDPDSLREDSPLPTLVGALERHGIRPLILLNANHNGPGPTRFFTARLAESAPAEARQVRLERGTARRVQPGHSGLNSSDGKAADVLFEEVRPDGTASLAKPLPEALEAGPHKAATLAYPPFGPPQLADGRPNPAFEETLDGWLRYARTVVGETRALMGSQDFDVEIWNELSFGSDFLYQERYYDPPRESGSGDVTRAILDRTVAMLRGPGSPAPEVAIGNGFASQTPFPAGSTSPPGLTALSKHPYYGIKRFPGDAVLNSITPLDARGRPSYEEEAAEGGPARRDAFIPRYDAFFPEYILSAIQTEHMIRDLSPIETEVHGTAHGRETHPEGSPPPEVWITEANLDPTGADPSDPGNLGSGPARLAQPDVLHLQAKAALRYYTAFVNKGASAMHLFAAKHPTLGLIEPGFFESQSGSGGPTPEALGRLARALDGAEELEHTDPLSLIAISEDGGRTQFAGDGSAAHPPLRDREITAFLPFQVRPGRYVAAAYVMTRNLAKPYSEGSDPERFDLPEAQFRFTIGDLEGRDLHASASDPLTGEEVEVEIVRRRGGRATIELPLTDSVRLITLDTR